MVPDLNSNNDGTASHASDGFGEQMICEASSAYPKVPSHECTINRESALTRYKEKKKTRRYYTTIEVCKSAILCLSVQNLYSSFFKLFHKLLCAQNLI